jgi:hypothetical protein
MPECCGCNVFKAMVNLSAFASLLFFVFTVGLMFNMIRHDRILFSMSVFYIVESLLFFKYYIDIMCLFRMRFRWHANRVWVPLADLCTVVLASSLAFNVVEWRSDGSLVGQLEEFTTSQLLGLVAVLVGLLFKLLSALLLTLFHIRLIKMHPSTTEYDNIMANYPYKASAPANDDIYERPE